MRIVKLTAENFKRLVAVEIEPDGSTIVITGKNGAGKSSVLDTITAAFCGKKAIPPKPIRDGQDHAEITLETEDFIIKRTFTAAGGGTLTVTNREDMKAASPQAFLDKIVGAIAFDPMSFVNDMDARQQKETLLTLVGLDLSGYDEKIAECKQKRSVINAQKQSTDVDLARITVTPDLPAEEVDMAALSEKLASQQVLNTALQAKKDAKVEKEAQLVVRQADQRTAKQELTRLQEQVKQAKEIIATRTTMIDGLTAEIADIAKELSETEPVDLATITQEIATANETNVNIRANLQAKELQSKIKGFRTTYKSLGDEMKEIEADKATVLSEADMPVKGLSVDESGVVFESIPLSQVNSAKQLEVGVAVSMALNPKLRVIRMNGNDLDADSLAIISKLVEDNDYQAWIERVDDTGKVGICIEDGMVVEPKQDTKKKTPKK